jgi:hypothetical protein
MIARAPRLTRMTLKRCTKCGEEKPLGGSAAIARGRTAAFRSAGRACAAGSRRTPSTWPRTPAAGSRPIGKSIEPTTAAIASERARTPNTVSEGEPTLDGAIGCDEPRTPTTGSGDEPNNRRYRERKRSVTRRRASRGKRRLSLLLRCARVRDGGRSPCVPFRTPGGLPCSPSSVDGNSQVL